MPSYLSDQQISELRTKLSSLQERVNKIILSVHQHRFRTERAREYYQHGFVRRIGTLYRCIENTFNLVPPEMAEVPSRTTLYDAAIQVQSFIANVFGSVDNLAWVFVYDRGLEAEIPRGYVGLRKSNVLLRSHFSIAFQRRLDEMDGWFAYISEYRDALAHRIPLYIPPGAVRPADVARYNVQPRTYDRLSAEQSCLLVFQPFITHSVKETTAHFAFHVQMLADFLTVEELWKLTLDELKAD
jgi:hypothetical protein